MFLEKEKITWHPDKALAKRLCLQWYGYDSEIINQTIKEGQKELLIWIHVCCGEAIEAILLWCFLNDLKECIRKLLCQLKKRGRNSTAPSLVYITIHFSILGYGVFDHDNQKWNFSLILYLFFKSSWTIYLIDLF